jgi:hypothetical protein
MFCKKILKSLLLCASKQFIPFYVPPNSIGNQQTTTINKQQIIFIFAFHISFYEDEEKRT